MAGKTIPHAKALDIIEKERGLIEKERGQHFDPIVADAFLDNIDEFLKIKDEVGADGDVPLPGL